MRSMASLSAGSRRMDAHPPARHSAFRSATQRRDGIAQPLRRSHLLATNMPARPASPEAVTTLMPVAAIAFLAKRPFRVGSPRDSVVANRIASSAAAGRGKGIVRRDTQGPLLMGDADSSAVARGSALCLCNRRVLRRLRSPNGSSRSGYPPLAAVGLACFHAPRATPGDAAIRPSRARAPSAALLETAIRLGTPGSHEPVRAVARC